MAKNILITNSPCNIRDFLSEIYALKNVIFIHAFEGGIRVHEKFLIRRINKATKGNCVIVIINEDINSIGIADKNELMRIMAMFPDVSFICTKSTGKVKTPYRNGRWENRYPEVIQRFQDHFISVKSMRDVESL